MSVICHNICLLIDVKLRMAHIVAHGTSFIHIVPFLDVNILPYAYLCQSHTFHSNRDRFHSIPDTFHSNPDTFHSNPDTFHSNPDTCHSNPDTCHSNPAKRFSRFMLNRLISNPDTFHSNPDTCHSNPDSEMCQDLSEMCQDLSEMCHVTQIPLSGFLVSC